jgi:D-3-phosphoglycerate dehydrogenase
VEAAGHTLSLLEKYTDKAQLLSAVADADALIIRSDKVDEEVLSAAKNLKIVVRAGAGYDNVDLAAATAHKVVVENTPGQNSNAVAELVFGMLVMAVRNMYAGTSGSELKGKRLGIHAFGQVGRNVARIAKGFGLEVSALDPYCPDSVMQEAGVAPLHDIKQLYADNKFVSLHIPATAETRGSVGYDLITLLPKDGVLINTARKEVIDEAGLAKALEERQDLKYVADIRPDIADDLLARFPGRVFFTPKKMGAQTAEANINAGIAAARQVVSFFTSGDTKFQVNK